jgi:hypothetical protein
MKMGWDQIRKDQTGSEQIRPDKIRYDSESEDKMR